jgi:hypothetical protein
MANSYSKDHSNENQQDSFEIQNESLFSLSDISVDQQAFQELSQDIQGKLRNQGLPKLMKKSCQK